MLAVFSAGRRILEGTPRAEPKLPAFLQPERPESAPGAADCCPVPWAPSAVAEPAAEKGMDASSARFLRQAGIKAFLIFSRYLEVAPRKGENREPPKGFVNKGHNGGWGWSQNTPKRI